MAYTITLIPDDLGGFLAVCPQLPEIMIFADTEDEARAEARRRIAEALEERRLIGKPASARGGSGADPGCG